LEVNGVDPVRQVGEGAPPGLVHCQLRERAHGAHAIEKGKGHQCAKATEGVATIDGPSAKGKGAHGVGVGQQETRGDLRVSSGALSRRLGPIDNLYSHSSEPAHTSQ
jgi:hypothetical protein